MTVTNLLQELEVVEDVGDMLTGDYMTVLCWEGEALTDCALVTTAALYSPVQYSLIPPASTHLQAALPGQPE